MSPARLSEPVASASAPHGGCDTLLRGMAAQRANPGRGAGLRVRAAVADPGHANVAITSAYLHVVVDDEEVVGNLFQFDSSGRRSG